MTIELSVNYSHAAAELQDGGTIHVDRFKCPAWPDMIAAAQARYPVYVHFPLKVGRGLGDAWDTEARAPADWRQIETLLAQTGTPLVNLHLSPTVDDRPELAPDSADPAVVEQLLAHTLRDLEAVTARFGAERVIVENVPGGRNRILLAAALPEFINRVVEASNCGLLLDLSHAQLAAHRLGLDGRRYVESLPTGRIREIHITGIHRVDEHWLALARAAGLPEPLLEEHQGQLQDHLPMTGDDWDFFAWAMDRIHNGAWYAPWAVTFEYGGVGRFFQAFTDAAMLAEQVPRLRELTKNGRAGAPQEVA